MENVELSEAERLQLLNMGFKPYEIWVQEKFEADVRKNAVADARKFISDYNKFVAADVARDLI